MIIMVTDEYCEILLDSVCEMGYQLMGCGCQVYRVEDTVRRIVDAYGFKCEAFAIPSCLIVSITDENNRVHTRMRQAKTGNINILTLERLNALSRQICNTPIEDPMEIARQAREITETVAPFPFVLQLIGFFIIASSFCMLFSGGMIEAIVSGLAGMISGGCSLVLSKTRSNFVVNTILSGFVLTLVGCSFYLIGAPVSMEAIIIGAIMVLVPGIVFTNFMADLLTGDIVTGLTTFAKALLTAGAIALGTGTAISVFLNFTEVAIGAVPPTVSSPLLSCALAFTACLGFCMPFNIRGTAGICLCCLGGALGWAIYLLLHYFGVNIYVSTLAASVVVSIYAEVMARLRKCPTSGYLVVSYCPLVPGFAIYQAMDYSIHGNIQMFLESFIKTFGIAGCIALGTLLVSTFLRVARTEKTKEICF